MLFLFQFSEVRLGTKHPKVDRAFIGDVLKKTIQNYLQRIINWLLTLGERWKVATYFQKPKLPSSFLRSFSKIQASLTEYSSCVCVFLRLVTGQKFARKKTTASNVVEQSNSTSIQTVRTRSSHGDIFSNNCRKIGGGRCQHQRISLHLCS